jgi:broad specificity polyphosphatase/5'/3'-nucleotidase SurE
MTVGTQMQKAIASVESVASSMKTFALETQDQQAKQMFQQLSHTFDDALNTLKQRQSYIEGQEPQYKQ